MHVVLTILKIIGIILLVLIGILVLLLLLLLFVPLRYRLHVSRKGDVLEADGRMTWLLHLLRADMTYIDSQGTAVIRVFGFRVKTFHFPKKDQEEEEKETPSAKKEEAESEVPSPKKDEEEAEREVPSPKKDESVQPVKADAVDAGGIEDQAAAGNAAEAIRSSGSGKRNRQEETSDSGRQKTRSDRPGLIGKIVRLFERVLQFILDLLIEIPVLPAEVHDRLEALQHKLEVKYDKLYRRIDPFFSIEAEHMLPKIIRYVQYLIRGYAPRKITGYLHFGTGAPDLTGKLVGLFYVLLPESGTEYDVVPDFYEAVLETDTTMTGQIRAYRLAWVSLRLLLDKEFRILFARIRGKEKVAKHRGAWRARKKAMLEEADKAA